MDVLLSDVAEVARPGDRPPTWPQFFNDQEIADKVIRNTVRYRTLVKQAIDAVMPSSTHELDHDDVTDILYAQRIAQLEEQRENQGGEAVPASARAGA